MAEMVSSAVAQEAVHQVLHRFKERYEHRSDAKERMERMEMAHIRLEAALEISHRWSVTSAPLLRWRSKLKRAALECDHTLRRCRQRLQQEEEETQSSSFPKRIAHAARSLVSSVFGRGDDDELGGGSAVRRFERFADGAEEFLRYVELGGAPRRFMSFDGALVRHLLSGKGTKHCLVQGGQHLSFVLHPFSTPEQWMEGALIFLLEDGDAPENNFMLTLSLRLSESTDIVGVVVRCLELFTPHLMSLTAETVKGKLTQLPTQDLCWVPDAYYVYGRDEHRDNLHTICSKWFRPNAFCCQQQAHDHYSTQQRYAVGSSSTISASLASDMYLEPVTQVYFLGHATLLSAGNNRQRSVVDTEARGFGHLKLGVNFWPHASSEDLPRAVRSSATETINGEATRRGLYSNISFEQLGEIMLPKAVDFLRGDVAASSYQMLWKSKHGRAYLQVEKTSSWRVTTRKGGERRGNKVQGWTGGISESLSSWIAHAPAQLLGSAVDWIQKQKRLPQSLLLKTSSCIQDCPIMQLSLQDLRSLESKIKSYSAFNALRF